MRLALVLVTAWIVAANALAAGPRYIGTPGPTPPAVTSKWGSLPNLWELEGNPPAGVDPPQRLAKPALNVVPAMAAPPRPGLTLIDANGAVSVPESTRTDTDVRHGITVIQGAPP